jgi:hypothetical protein
MNDDNRAAVQVLGTMLLKVRDQLYGVVEFNPLELRTEIDQLLQSEAITSVAAENKKNTDRLNQLEDILHQLYVQSETTANVLSQIVKRPVAELPIEPAKDSIQTPEVASQADH